MSEVQALVFQISNQETDQYHDQQLHETHHANQLQSHQAELHRFGKNLQSEDDLIKI